MSIATTDLGTLLIILIMALVTLATRWGGVFIMAFVPISRRVQQFIRAMSGSVLIALLAPLAAQGDGGAKLALLVTAGVALVLKTPLPAISDGIVAAALFRQKIRLLMKRLWLSISRKRRIMSLLCSSTS